MVVEPVKAALPALQPEIKSKGVSFQHLREFVIARFGHEAWVEVLARLGPEGLAVFSAPILASGWYPYAAYVEVERIVVKRFMGGDNRRAREIGAHDLEAGLNRVYKAFYRMGSPAFIIRMSALLWGQYFNVGRMVIQESGPGHAIARIEDFAAPDDACCWDIYGSMVRGLELSGAKSIQGALTTCPHKGGAYIQYEARWVE